jgi:acyl dehydratase
VQYGSTSSLTDKWIGVAACRPDRGLVVTRNEVVNQLGEVVLEYNPARMVREAPVQG